MIAPDQPLGSLRSWVVLYQTCRPEIDQDNDT